jgi:hypothetical protein
LTSIRVSGPPVKTGQLGLVWFTSTANSTKSVAIVNRRTYYPSGMAMARLNRGSYVLKAASACFNLPTSGIVNGVSNNA